jgi:predicted transcriptional regulator
MADADDWWWWDVAAIPACGARRYRRTLGGMNDELPRVPTVDDLGRAMRLARTEKGLTQSQLASLAHVGLNTVVRLERGAMPPRTPQMMALIHVVGWASWWRHLRLVMQAVVMAA